MSDTRFTDTSCQKYLSPKEFAARTGISLATVRRYLKSGRVVAHQPGGRRHRVLIPADALEQVAPSTPPRVGPDRSSPAIAPLPGHPAADDKSLCGPAPKWLRQLPR